MNLGSFNCLSKILLHIKRHIIEGNSAEVGADINIGGTQIGTATVKALFYVHDIATINTNDGDVYNSHEKVKALQSEEKTKFRN